MNDENEDVAPTVLDSKCNTCKYGMCVLDKDVHSFVQPETVEGNSFEGNPSEQALSETQFPVNKVRSMCFWRPEGMSIIAPVIFNCVATCSRYTKQ